MGEYARLYGATTPALPDIFDGNRVGQPWGPNEDKVLEWRYTKTHQTIAEIARRHGRNTAGIEVRIEKLGLKR